LTEERFVNYLGLGLAGFSLSGVPWGTNIQSVNGVSPTEATIVLSYIGVDFDVDSNNFVVNIDSSLLIQTESGILTSSALIIDAYVENPEAVLIPDLSLEEYNLDGRTLTLNLTEEQFVEFTTIQATNFSLVDAPAGTGIQSVSGLSPTQAEIGISFDGTDFDTAYNSFAVSILASELIQTVSGSLVSGPLTISAYEEYPTATLSSDSTLRESNLDFQTLYISFSEEEFEDYQGLTQADFALYGAPGGLSIQSVNGTSPISVEIDLRFVETDFDQDSTNFAVDISSDVLMQTTSGFLRTSSLPVFAYNENPEAFITEDDTLREYTLDERYLTLTLTDERFQDYTALSTSGFTLTGAPLGTSIQSVTGNSPTNATLHLAFDGTDFDLNINTLAVSILSDILFQTTSGSLVSNSLTAYAYVESPEALIVPDVPLLEANLDGRSLALTLTEDNFLNHTGLQTTDFSLVNPANGLSIQSVSVADPYHAVIGLRYTGTDFDTDIPDFGLDINASVLKQTTSGFLASN
ncbi:MAG: hypothetical protein KAT15_14865, partial [Bacteroidales bacterium]|nr:hypothetical protein [Bacteroidales bacterium]